jgi:hypothetical protein
MQFTVDYINENIDIWEAMKKKGQQHIVIEKSTVATPNSSIPPQQPSPEGKCNTSSRPRSGI